MKATVFAANKNAAENVVKNNLIIIKVTEKIMDNPLGDIFKHFN